MSNQRTISAIVMMILAGLAIAYDRLFITVILLLTAGGLYEFFYLIKKKDIPIYSYVGIFIGLLIPISIYTRFELTKNWELLFIVLGFLLILLLQFARRDNHNAIVGISTTLFGILYISWFFSFLIKIRLMLPGIDGAGIKLLAFLVIVTKAGDIGALLVGSKFGKHPLLPKVSPHKSIEGYLGSLAFSVAFAMIFRSFLPSIFHFPLIQVALMGAFFGAIGQLGDLSESMIKRDCHVKDSGKLLPGIGGVLDVIDSLLFSAPAFYLFMTSVVNTF